MTSVLFEVEFFLGLADHARHAAAVLVAIPQDRDGPSRPTRAAVAPANAAQVHVRFQTIELRQRLYALDQDLAQLSRRAGGFCHFFEYCTNEREHRCPSS